MAYWKGTLLASPIVRGSSGDTYGTHHSILGVGGYLEVNTITERNNLPIDSDSGIGYDGISSGQRRLGMLVYVHEDDTIYQLRISRSTWDDLTRSGKLSALENNNNWNVFVSGENQEESGEKIYKQFTQTTYDFVKGDVVGYDGNEFLKINSITANEIEPLGIVNKEIDDDTFELTFAGYIKTSGITDVNSNDLSGGTVYYLSETDGKLTPNKPNGSTEVAKPMLATINDTTGIVLQYRKELTSGNTVSYNEFTGYTATTQQYLDETITGATNIGFFTGYTGIQTLPINNLDDNDYDGDYISVYNNYYRGENGEIKIGTPNDEIERRGYVKNTTPSKSWIWNEYTDDGAPNGWILIDGDITSDDIYGSIITGSSINYSTPAYTNATWSGGTSYNNGSQIVIDKVQGDLNTGSTLVNGGLIYEDKIDKELRLRTIVSKTPESIDVTYDDYFIKLSGGTSINVQNIGIDDGVGIYSGTSGNTIFLKKLVGGGGTEIDDDGENIVISSSPTGDTGGSGENVTKTITQYGHRFSVGDVIGYSGDSYNKAIADGNYDGEIIGIVSEVIDVNNFNIRQSGYIKNLNNLTENTTYFVSPTNAGEYTDISPTDYGDLVKPILFADSEESGWVLHYPGYIITKPVTGDTSGGTIYYTGKTPSVCTVGGLEAGSTLTGKTISKIMEEILVPELCGTITEPSTSISLSESGLYEIGCNIDQTVTANFDRGSISPQYCSDSPYRSGPPVAYCFDGDGMPSGLQACTNTTASETNSDYTIVEGTQSWSVFTQYEEGEPALSSNGTEYCAALSSGCTSSISDCIIGTYPLWATCSTISSLDKISPLYNMSTANDIEIDLVSEGDGNKQKFEIPCAWLDLRSLNGVQQFNTVSGEWEYPGGDASSSLELWDCSSATETIQGNSVGYCQYTHACSDRDSVSIKLIF